MNTSRTLPFRSLACSACLLLTPLYTNAESPNELLGMSLEKLMSMETLIVSASKTDQKVADSAAAVFVISKEDIRRSGSTHIADILKMVPGLISAKNSSSEWVVAIRGFAGKFTGDVLVMIDGRSVFSSLQNTVNWDEQNLALEDIERIEVVRGPGGSLWGSNAVNGVINIITKSPDQLEGTRFSASGGEGDKAKVYGAYGGAFGETGNFSISAHHTETGGFDSQNFDLEEKDWNSTRIRLGVTWESGDNVFDINADSFKVESNPYWPQYVPIEPYTIFNAPEEEKDGYALQARWNHALSETSSINTRVSVDDVERRSLNFFWDTFNIDFDIEWHNEFEKGHQLGVGFNSRKTESLWETFDLLDIDVTPPEVDVSVYSTFLQYTHFFTDNFRVIAGAKFEENSEAGDTLQPTLRSLWKLSDEHRLWAALSKSEATSSRLEYSPALVEVAVFPPSAETFGLPTIVLFDNDGSKTDNQELVSTQIGYRFTPVDSFNLDITAFYNEYENRTDTSPLIEQNIIFTTIPNIPDPVPAYIEVRTFPSNDGTARAHGFEMAVSWQAIENWHLQYSGTYLDITDSDLASTTLSTITESSITRSAPGSWSSLRSLYNFSDNVDFDVWIRYTDSIEFSTVKSYYSADIRLGWHINENIELSLIARNLSDDPYVEYHREAFLVDRFLVEEAYSLKLDAKF